MIITTFKKQLLLYNSNGPIFLPHNLQAKPYFYKCAMTFSYTADSILMSPCHNSTHIFGIAKPKKPSEVRPHVCTDWKSPSTDSQERLFVDISITQCSECNSCHISRNRITKLMYRNHFRSAHLLGFHTFWACGFLCRTRSESMWVAKCAYQCVKVCVCVWVIIGKARCRLAGCLRVKELSSPRQKQWINYCSLSLGRVSLPPSFSRSLIGFCVCPWISPACGECAARLIFTVL